MIAALEPTFCGINLEDIKVPDCFIVERECRKPNTARSEGFFLESPQSIYVFTRPRPH